MFRRFAVLVLTLLLAACNLSVPQVTPTVAPTRTPTDAPAATDTPVPTVLALLPTATTIPPSATLTFTPSATFTLPPTDTATATASATHTHTPTDTNAPTATPTGTATDTPPTNTPTPTQTPTPTNTDAPTATVTDTPLPTATNTLPPTVTPLPLFPTDTPVPTSTPPPAPTITLTPSITNTATNPPPPTFTAFPTGTATRQLSPLELTLMAERTATAAAPSPAPTLDVTPTFITVEAPSQSDLTPIQSDTTPQPALPTFTYTPQPTVALVGTLPPTLGAPPSLPTIIPINPQTRAFALSTTGGISGFSLPHNDPTLFARNPLDPNLFASTDEAGNLYLTGTINQRLNSSPFMQDITPLTREENNAYVAAIAWSPDGTQMAFIVAGRKLADDGVWVFDLTTFDPLQLLVDCPTKDFPGCFITRERINPDYWESRWLRWSPQNDALLVGVHIPQENRDGIVILPRSYDEDFRSVRPPVLRYQFAAWGRDGQRVLVSGAAPDGRLTVEWLDQNGVSVGRVFEPEVFGLWLGYANEAADGQIYALGAPGDRSGPREPLHIYNMVGQAMTPAIGSTGIVERVEWSPDGTQVFVETGGQQFVATIGGSVREITGQVAGARAVSWVEGDLPPGSEPTPAPPVVNPAEPPSGVIEGSRFQPGQQLRVLDFQLNIRSGPGVEYDQVRIPLLPGEYVAVLAGPVNTPDGYTWWRVQAADGTIGWVADAIGGAPTLG